MKITKLLSVLLSLTGISLLLSSCYSSKKAVESSLPYSDKINWPEGYKPSEAGFFVHNEIDIQASPQRIWDILIHAAKWPEWHKKAQGIVLLNSPDGKLNPSSVFIWSPAGKFTSTIKEFNPPYNIAWYGEMEGKKMTIYNAWLIIPTKEGCKVVINESQNGPRTKLEKIFAPNMLRKDFRDWLMGLKERAEKKSDN
ncbi:SRPBCC domain-containing protein [Mucilaginibacter gossypii]|uniref:Polyketide cyclase / dehydrase and lipid transport n=1 Tax=Mucilaginibacter gossypii TaxID=551996 RepID=A0A1G8CS03_9SPHI|nr:SRPBCC domain-containing protein [Mucilaginibacter gossypii]SDH48134.1 Polyketide cyclase / dehydrase and lipid transport [Mucilaginibacter gossypii]